MLVLVCHASAVEPLVTIRDNCLRCHSTEKRKGGLVLATHQAMLKGGESGAVIDLKEPEKSLLLQVLQKDADPHMPPKKQLAKEKIAGLRQWIADGAKWDAAILESVPTLEPVTWINPSTGRPTANAVTVAPDGITFAVAQGNRIEIRLMEEKAVKVQKVLESHMGSVQSLVWNPDGSFLASGGFRKAIVWDVETGKPVQVIEDKFAGRITAAAFINNGQRLILADSLPTRLGQLHVFRTLGWSRVKTIRAHTDSIYALAISPNGKYIASAGADKLARIWDADTLQSIGTLEGHTDYVLAASFSPNSKRIATTSADHSVKIWDVKSRNEEITFSPRKSTQSITGIHWTLNPTKDKPEENDDWIVTVSADGIPRLFTQLVNHEGKQTSAGAKEQPWAGTEGQGLTALAWSPEHKRILTTDDKGILHFRDINGKRWPEKPKEAEEPKTKTNPETLGFRNDILPILSRAGCASGSCHAKSGGQNGFQLSIFAYDPMADHRAIVFANRGRRTFPNAPAQSLLLQKATETIDHEGGKRFDKDSAFYRTLHQWITQGTPFAGKEEPSLIEINVEPTVKIYNRNEKLNLKVTASYSDNSLREVTHLAHFQSNNKTLASIDENGRVTAGKHHGEAVLIIRYMDQVDVSRVTIPRETILPESTYAALPVHNEIDRLNYARHKKLGILISDKCPDNEFLRRVSLDATGKLPSVKTTRDFLTDKSPDKRQKFIDQLLNDPDWADYWATRLGDLLRPNTKRVGVKPVYLLDRWVRRQLRANTPWDQFVRELLTVSGSSHQSGPVALFRDKREPASAGAFVSRMFLGIRLECAQCHHHPNEKWGQDDYYQLAAFFGSMKHKGQGISAPISGEPEYWWFQPGGNVKHPVTGEVMSPKPPDGPQLEIPKGSDPRTTLVDWMIRPENPFFAKAIVNRIWGEIFGIGIVDPVDDFRASNPPSNGPLLDWLARDFISHGYDLKHLMRRILHSRTYQTSSLPNKTNAADHRNFSRSIRRRLSAEVIADAVDQLIGLPEDYQGLPENSRAMHVWNTAMPSTFLDTFGRPDASAECPCERDPAPTIIQTLHLANSSRLIDRIARKGSRATTLIESDDKTEQIINDIYLAAYSRFPTNKELKTASEAFAQDGANRRTATEDIVWALINSAEFVLNH
jgi:WD40 repeat protein